MRFSVNSVSENNSICPNEPRKDFMTQKRQKILPDQGAENAADAEFKKGRKQNEKMEKTSRIVCGIGTCNIHSAAVEDRRVSGKRRYCKRDEQQYYLGD